MSCSTVRCALAVPWCYRPSEQLAASLHSAPCAGVSAPHCWAGLERQTKMPTPSSKRQPSALAKPSATSGAAMRFYARRLDKITAERLAVLADRRGMTPGDLADVYRRHADWAKRDKVDVAALDPHLVSAASGLFRAGIAATLAKVDEHNARVIASRPELAATHEARNGDIRLRPAAKPEPAVPKRKPDQPRKPRGVEILGQPATVVIRLASGLGLSFGDVRLALDELGGRGISDATIRLHLNGGPVAATTPSAELNDAGQAELLAFKGRGKPETEIKQERRAKRKEERSRQVVPLSAPSGEPRRSRFSR